MILTKLTEEGCQTLIKHPERIKEVNKEVEEMGARVVSQYVIFGEHDFLSIIEAPDNETIAKISVNLSSRGSIRITSYPAIEVESFIETLKK